MICLGCSHDHLIEFYTEKFKVYVEDVFEIAFDTIDKAREMRKVLMELNYENIHITVEDEDVNPYNKE